MKVVTQANSERVARFALEYARKNGRKKVTIVHKANIMLVIFVFKNNYDETLFSFNFKLNYWSIRTGVGIYFSKMDSSTLDLRLLSHSKVIFNP